MTFDRDYVLRIVREFAASLARILRSARGHGEARTLDDLDALAESFVGLRLDALEALPADQITMMLGLGGTLDVNRAYAAGRLLNESAQMARESERDEEAHVLSVKALRLLIEAEATFGEPLNDEHEDVLHDVTDRVLAGPGEIPPDLLESVLDLALRHGHEDRVRGIAAAIAARRPEAEDAMTALRIALRGQGGLVLGRVAPVLDAAPSEE